MLIKSVIIKLTRRGADISPDYSLTIHGYGTVTYEGNDNVGIKGRKEEPIAENKVMDLLSEFKRSNFFSFDENYIVEKPMGRPSTTISISLPGENGEVKTTPNTKTEAKSEWIPLFEYILTLPCPVKSNNTSFRL